MASAVHMLQYFKNIFIWLDQGVNTIFKGPLNFIFQVKGFGYPDETISSVLGKNYKTCHACRIVCKFLSFVFNSHHCRQAIEEDEGLKNG